MNLADVARNKVFGAFNSRRSAVYSSNEQCSLMELVSNKAFNRLTVGCAHGSWSHEISASFGTSEFSIMTRCSTEIEHAIGCLRAVAVDVTRHKRHTASYVSLYSALGADFEF